MTDQRHFRSQGLFADAAEHSELLVLIVTAHNAAGRDRIGPHKKSLLHIGYLDIFVKVIHAEGGELQHEGDLARIGRKAFFCNALMHSDGIGTSGDHLAQGVIYRIKARHDTAGNGVVHS